MANLKPYVDQLSSSQQEKDEALAPLRAAEMQQEGSLRIAKLDQEIHRAELQIATASSQYPLNYDTVADNIDNLELLQLRRKRLVEIHSQLFPAKK